MFRKSREMWEAFLTSTVRESVSPFYIFVTLRACHERFDASRTSSALFALLNASPKSANALQHVSRWLLRSSRDSFVIPETIAYTNINAAVKVMWTTWMLARRNVYRRLYWTRSLAMSTADWTHMLLACCGPRPTKGCGWM
jgi:hypothetical protein